MSANDRRKRRILTKKAEAKVASAFLKKESELLTLRQ
jgi:hypothetical protein